MLFIAYWELRDDQSIEERAAAIEEQGLLELTLDGDFEVLRWDVTPANWGIIVIEADDVKTVDKAFSRWRAKQPWFQKVKVGPAQPATDRIEMLGEVLEEVSE